MRGRSSVAGTVKQRSDEADAVEGAQEPNARQRTLPLRLGSFGERELTGDRATAGYLHICVFSFLFRCPIRFSKGNANAAHRSGRDDNAGLVEARPGAARPVF
jgi:hypothetical protein